MKRQLQSILKTLARLTIKKYQPGVIGVTGSVGKTSAKEAIYAVLRTIRRVRASSGNFNNEIGLPLTVLGDWQKIRGPFFWLRVIFCSIWQLIFKSVYPEILILEYAADKPGDIKYLMEIAKPNIGVVTAIGPRQATRLAFYLIQQGKGAMSEIVKSLVELSNLKPCANCFFPHVNSKQTLCHICGDSKRNKGIIAIVEKETDLISLENTKKFNGRYLIIGSLKRGTLESDQKLRLNNLKNFIKKELGGKADEIIIAFNPTTYGNLSAGTVANELKDFAKKITRLSRGLPTGGEIEFADEETLGEALDKRS